MTTETKFTAADFAKAIQYVERHGVGPEIEYVVLDALRIAQRVMTPGVIGAALADHLGFPHEERSDFSEEEAVIRDALTREEKA